MNVTTVIPLPVAVPFIVAAFLALAGKRIGRRACDALAIAAAASNLLITAFILRGVWSQPQVYWFGNWLFSVAKWRIASSRLPMDA